MRTSTPPAENRRYAGFVPFAAGLALLLTLAAGCHRKTGPTLPVGQTSTDPMVASNLAYLTYELHAATPHSRFTNFEGFVAASGVEVPPPPAGQKYALGQGWKVVLVDAKAK